MTATPARLRLPLTTHNRRRCAVHPEPQEKTKTNQSSNRAILRTSSFDAKIDYVSVAEKEQVHPETETIFRQTVWTEEEDEMEELWTLKRANPITDESEDVVERTYASPSKRQRTQQLDWKDKVPEEAPYLLDMSVLEKISVKSE